MKDRRKFFQRVITGGIALGASSRLRAKEEGTPVPVVTTDIPDLPFTTDNGVKVFHLTAEPVKRQIAPNKTLDLWGFNGVSPGPTIQVTQGDRVRVIVDNHLPEPTSMHWHGFEVPIAMDGSPDISQKLINPGERFVYEWTLHQQGTYFYHSHMAMQEMLGMLGAFIMHPKVAHEPRVDKDFAVLLQEYAVLPNNTIPNTMSMEFNWLTFNGKAGPASTPIVVRLGDRVRIRMINLGMDHHPIHLHGHTFEVTGTEGGRIPNTAWIPGNTVLVGVAQARDFEFVANNPGDWMLHCHLPHHMMNQMSSNVGPMSRINAGANSMMQMPAGLDMKNGMGMLQGTPGVPSGDDYGPGLGRGMGVGSTSDQAVANGPMSHDRMANMQSMPEHDMSQHDMSHMNHSMPDMEGMQAGISANANQVPGFPQDAYMEGPMMNMDSMITSPETYGLAKGWTTSMQGMMTLVRVLPPDKYDELMERIRNAKPNSMPGMKM
jgi:manganese oxidase